MTGPIAATLSTRSDSKRELDPQIHLNSPQGSAWAVRPWLLRFLWLKMTEDDPRWSKHSDRVIVFCHSWWTEVWQSLVRSIPECRCGHWIHWVQGFSSTNRVDGTLIFYPTLSYVNGEDMGRHVWSILPCTSASGWTSSANCVGRWPGKATTGGNPPGLLSLLPLFAHDRQSSQCDNPVWGEGHSRWISANCNLVGGFKHFLFSIIYGTILPID